MQPDYHCNYDLETIVTPEKINKLINELRMSKYDKEEIKFLEEGFTQGFNIGYEGPMDCRSTAAAENIPLTVRNKVELWNKVMKEVKLKRVTGPYEQVPFDNFIQSPIGLVPKAGWDQTRLIFHLSYDW